MTDAQTKDRVYNTHVLGRSYPWSLGDIVDETLKQRGTYPLRHCGRELEDVERLWGAGNSCAQIADKIMEGRERGIY